MEQEFAVLAAVGLEPRRQSQTLGEDGTAYHVFDASGGLIWFDISSFFGQGS